MREIKFRAWHKPNNFMLFPINKENDLQSAGGLFTSGLGDAIAYPEFYDLLQFTGLHDKKGKEIYEGDIILRPVDPTEWNKKHFNIREPSMEKALIVWDEENAGFDERFRPAAKMHPCFEVVRMCDADVEVIGNIYENGELKAEIERVKDKGKENSGPMLK